jgi:DNA-binding transcriptional MerR regulator
MNLAIGELARRTGVKIPTIRYYEQIGLLPAAPRTQGKQRRYGPAEVKRLNFIRHARELAFDVDDIRQLLALSETPQRSCHAADSIAMRHLDRIAARIRQLDALRAELQRMVDECGHGRICECRIVEVIGDHSLCTDEMHLDPHGRKSRAAIDGSH